MKGPGRRKRRQPAEVVTSLRQTDEALAAGKPIAEVARSLGVSSARLHRWRKEYGSADRDAIRGLKELQKANARLERLWRAGGLLVVLDEFTRECLALEVGRRCRGGDVVAVLDELTAIRDAPRHIRRGNGPQFICGPVKRWCAQSGTGTLYIDPGAPWQDGIVEIFNGRLRD